MKRTAEAAPLRGINSMTERTFGNITMASLYESAKSMICTPLAYVSSYYSSLIDKKLSLRQTAHILNAQMAFTFTVFPVDCPLTLRFAALAWLAAALRGCKKSGLGE